LFFGRSIFPKQLNIGTVFLPTVSRGEERRQRQHEREKRILKRKVSIVRHIETKAAKYLDSGKVRSESGRW
jgi:hypothetical protein